MEDNNIDEEYKKLEELQKDIENWSDMLERQKKERELKRIAEEREKKLDILLKKKRWW